MRLFLDSGGVLLSGGWDHHTRQRAATNSSWIVLWIPLFSPASSACAKLAWFELRDDERLIRETC
jgi:hypothetical protein